MRKIWFGQSECRGEAVCYYLVVEETAEVERYGLQVRCGGEKETMKDITSSQRQIQILLETMVRGGVTPITAREIVEDWLAGLEV